MLDISTTSENPAKKVKYCCYATIYHDYLESVLGGFPPKYPPRFDKPKKHKKQGQKSCPF